MGQQGVGAIAEQPSTQDHSGDVDFRAMVEHAADGIFVLSADTLRFLYVNRALAEMLRCEPEALVGRPVGEVLALEPPAEELTRGPELVAEQTARSECTLRRCDGSSLVAEIRMRRSRNRAYQAIVRDVTTAREREEKLERQTSALAERVKELRCLYAVSEVLSSSSVDWQEVVDLLPFGWQHPEVAAARLSFGDCAYTSAGFRETPWSLSEPIFVDGQIAGRITVAYLEERVGDSGEVFLSEERDLLTAIAARIAETLVRERLAGALTRREAYYRTLAEKASDLVLIADGDGILRYVSPSIERLLGYRPEEKLGMVAQHLLHPDDIEDAAESRAELLARPNSVVHFRYRLRHRDGSWRVFETTVRNLLADPLIRGMVVNGRDVTERAQLETQLLHAQKMEAVGRLAGGVAHDFNNILTAITGFSAVALSSLSEGDPVREDIAEIERAAGRAAALTRKLLAFSRRQVLQPERIDVAETVRDMEQALQRLIGEHIELVSELDVTGGTVRIDAGQLEQVIMNLAVNARDAMPQGGVLTLRVSNVAVAERSEESAADGVKPGRYVLLEVEDNGSGVDEQTLPLIFEPFFTTKSSGDGTGLGLSTVFGIARQSGGVAAARSRPGVGTAIRVYIPRAEGRARSQSEPMAAAAEPGAGTVLVAEDEERVRRLICRVLENCGYRVIEAEDGAEALERFDQESGQIDLLLTDLVMPRLNGVRLAEELRARIPELPCLFMSGYAGDGPAARIAGEEDFIGKPFGPDQVADRVARALRRAGRG